VLKLAMKLRLALAIALVVLALPAAAGAARVDVFGTTGPAAEQVIDFRAAGGERNRVHVLIRESSVTIVDLGIARIELGRDTGCTRTSARRVVCPRYPILLDLKDRDDTLDFAPGDAGADHPRTHPLSLQADYVDHGGRVLEAATVDAGSGDDVVTGTRFRDAISPGSGRDRVEGRGGPDTIYVTPDSKPDRLDGDGGIDALRFDGSPHHARVPVTVDLAAGTAAGGSDADRIGGFERVHGGPEGDTLMGTGGGDALYGEYGRDAIFARAGNDLVVGDSPTTSKGFADTLDAGPGDDIVDVRSARFTPTNGVDCGNGTDRVVGEHDDYLEPSCEFSVFRTPAVESFAVEGTPYYRVRMKVAPVEQDAGSVTFSVPCPPKSEKRSRGCEITVTLSQSPRRHAGAEQYGSHSAHVAAGRRKDFEVPLNPAGRYAVASGQPIAVDVTGYVVPISDNPPPSPADEIGFGWQRVLAP
jgi:hypothetical protein